MVMQRLGTSSETLIQARAERELKQFLSLFWDNTNQEYWLLDNAFGRTWRLQIIWSQKYPESLLAARFAYQEVQHGDAVQE